jgi:hypothetical protein
VAASFRPLLLRTLDDLPPDALEIELTYRSVRDSGSTPLHDNFLHHLQLVLAAERTMVFAS